jgi:hypothetical protein
VERQGGVGRCIPSIIITPAITTISRGGGGGGGGGESRDDGIPLSSGSCAYKDIGLVGLVVSRVKEDWQD